MMYPKDINKNRFNIIKKKAKYTTRDLVKDSSLKLLGKNNSKGIISNKKDQESNM